MIKTASECSIKGFMECMFNENFAVLGEGQPSEQKEAWQQIYTEYVDLSGLAQTTELHLLKVIQGLQCRLVLINTAIDCHKESLRVSGQPFWPSFKDLKKYGHALWWNKDSPDMEGFQKRLDSVLVKEKRYEMELESRKTELYKHMENNKAQAGEKTTRKDFIRLLNQLDKFGFTIDKEKTTVEDLAVMQCDYNSACEETANRK